MIPFGFVVIFIVLYECQKTFLLFVTGLKDIGDNNAPRRKDYPFSSISRKLYELLGRDAVAHEKRQFDPQLLDVLGNHGRTRIGSPADYGLCLAGTDFRKLGSHVCVFRAVRRILYDLNAEFCSIRLELLPSGRTEAVRYCDNSNLADSFSIQMLIDFCHCQSVILRRLEYPSLQRIRYLAPGST